MKASFWHQRWQAGEIGFHQSAVNPLLAAHIGHLGLEQGARIFLPLCGKTHDIAWLLEQGYSVAGAELSELAVKALFESLALSAEVSRHGALLCYRAEGLDIFVGDIFDLGADTLGPVDGVYDRAALVALPEDMRSRYTAHLLGIAVAAPQLLITYEYDQQAMSGPPFSVMEAEVRRHYAASYHMQALVQQPVAGGLKGKVASSETLWLLKKKDRA